MKLSLLEANGKKTHDAAGINWGIGPGNVCTADAYIPIYKKNILAPNNIIDPKNITMGKSYKAKFDDDVTMMISFEQNGPVINGDLYPKAISSYNDKSELGVYLRGRLGVSNKHRVTLNDLLVYGRTDIDIKISSNCHLDFEIDFR